MKIRIEGTKLQIDACIETLRDTPMFEEVTAVSDYVPTAKETGLFRMDVEIGSFHCHCPGREHEEGCPNR